MHLQENSIERLIQYVIYENPSDYPNKFVLRKWLIHGDSTVSRPVVSCGEVLAVNDSIEEIRAFLPEGVDALPVFANDDPVIREVWM